MPPKIKMKRKRVVKRVTNSNKLKQNVNVKVVVGSTSKTRRTSSTPIQQKTMPSNQASPIIIERRGEYANLTPILELQNEIKEFKRSFHDYHEPTPFMTTRTSTQPLKQEGFETPKQTFAHPSLDRHEEEYEKERSMFKVKTEMKPIIEEEKSPKKESPIIPRMILDDEPPPPPPKPVMVNQGESPVNYTSIDLIRKFLVFNGEQPNMKEAKAKIDSSFGRKLIKNDVKLRRDYTEWYKNNVSKK